MLLWTWDENKSRRNIRFHGISFETAVHVFDDRYAATLENQYRDEQRWRTMGMIGTVFVVAIHTWPEYDDESGDELGRIISARKATKHEREAYEEGKY